MKGALKTLKRAPQLLGSKVGLSHKSQDPEVDELIRKFAGLEDYTQKLLKDCSTFRDAVSSMLASQAGFGTAFATLFQPMAGEMSLSSAHPEAAKTLQNISSYQEVMDELRDAIQPELELVDSRVLAPLKEYQELLKKVRKTITKRDHKLVDFDRFNNSYSKLKDKKEKSLNDEKNLFKLEQDLELATQEYEHYNNALKSEIPHFMQLTTAFISPLFQTFYFVKIGILYTLLEKMQGWAGETYGEMDITGLEQMHSERLGDTIEQLDALTITRRFGGTARMMAEHRQGSDSTSSLGRAGSVSSSISKVAPPPSRFAPAAAAEAVPPPPYSGGGAVSPVAGKRAPPPPPARMGSSTVTYVTALYDYAATADGDLSFSAGEKIKLVKKTASESDWWTGEINGVQGVFPGNYVQL